MLSKTSAHDAFTTDAACLCANQEPRRIIVGALSLLVCERCQGLIIRLRKEIKP